MAYNLPPILKEILQRHTRGQAALVAIVRGSSEL
jgi:hypothetical protein